MLKALISFVKERGSIIRMMEQYQSRQIYKVIDRRVWRGARKGLDPGTLHYPHTILPPPTPLPSCFPHILKPDVCIYIYTFTLTGFSPPQQLMFQS
jgi:hypothetical protein